MSRSSENCSRDTETGETSHAPYKFRKYYLNFRLLSPLLTHQTPSLLWSNYCPRASLAKTIIILRRTIESIPRFRCISFDIIVIIILTLSFVTTSFRVKVASLEKYLNKSYRVIVYYIPMHIVYEKKFKSEI